jgi:hypothetical protein
MVLAVQIERNSHKRERERFGGCLTRVVYERKTFRFLTIATEYLVAQFTGTDNRRRKNKFEVVGEKMAIQFGAR